MNKDRIISLRLDEETYQRLKSLADRTGASLSETIRRHLVPVRTNTYVNPPWYGNATSSTYPGATITWTNFGGERAA